MHLASSFLMNAQLKSIMESCQSSPPGSATNNEIPVSNSAASLSGTQDDDMGRVVRVLPLFLLMRTAMRISRARWFIFLRRVFHYQNGTRSDLGSNPFNSSVWITLEFIVLVVQITAITFTISISKNEKPVWPLRIWVVGYDIASILGLPLLYWRHQHRHRHGSHRLGFHIRDIEQQFSVEESRSSHFMNRCRTFLELFFAIWFVMGNVWVFDSRIRSFDRAPKLHILCISLLAWNAASYSFPFLLFFLLCCCVPLISNLLGYNMNLGSIQRGASDDQISELPKKKYMELASENSECCICLAIYQDKDEVRQLPCSHIFHVGCVDQWLRIISCCPLCKRQIN